MTGIELTVAGWVASPAIRMVVDTARSYLGSNYNEHKKTHEMLDNLENTLLRVEGVVELAEQRPSQSKAMSKWLKKLKLVVSNAEDVLDDFEAKAIREKLKSKGKVSEIVSSSVKTLRNIIFSSKDLKRLKRAVGRIQSVCSGDFLKTMELHDEDGTKGSTITDRNETSSVLPKNMKFLGRDKEVELILDLILRDDSSVIGESSINPKPESSINPKPKHKKGELSGTEMRNWNLVVNNWSLGVLPIVGIKGVGKTTLAQVIYNNESVKKHFTMQAWVYVSENSDNKNLTHDIIYSFGSIDSISINRISKKLRLDEFHQTLNRILQNKRFFLVLDDVWDDILKSTTYTGLRSVLTQGAPGSVVIVTTQLETVANEMRTLPLVKLEALEWEYFWPLFKHYAFGNFKFDDNKTNTLLPPKEQKIKLELESIGEKIAEKLGGIPLAAEIVGSLLSSKLNIDNWREISRSDWWNIKGASKEIYPFLGVGYQNLDPELKQAFLFGSIFPKGFVFQKNKLVQMWISHGFVQPTVETQQKNGEKRLEDIGSERFDSLLDRFFFQPTILENNYVMHDLVRDLAIAISSSEFCIITNDVVKIPAFVCHLALNNNDHLVTDLGDSNYETLCTLLLFGYSREPMDKDLANIFKKSSSLRSLNLSYMNMGTNKFPDIFTKLSHLRFLDLSFTGINFLPETISHLCHLLVLDLRGCMFEKLPKEINKLINLRHLYASKETISLITGIGKLANLQELESFDVQNKDGHRINELKDLNEIRGKLNVNNLQFVSTEEEATDSNLIQKRHLKSLILGWRYNFRDSESAKRIVERLKPPSNLQELKIWYYPWIHSPNWLVQNENFHELKYLSIKEGFMEVLPPLGQLPSLETLSLIFLGSITKINPQFYGSKEVAFPCLKELTFFCMDEWEDWSSIEARQTFPELRKLDLAFCKKLKQVPAAALNKSISELSIKHCDGIVKEIGDSLREMRALTKLAINATPDCKATLPCCEYLSSVEVLSLANVLFNMVEGPKYLVELKELNLSGNCLELVPQSKKDKQSPHKHVFQKLTKLMLKSVRNENLCIFGMVPWLRTLSIHGLCLYEFTEEQETWFGQLTSIKELEFNSCCNLIHIPSSITTLSSLNKLKIISCQSIKSLPNRLPENLKELYINHSSQELTERCNLEGPDRPNISHVPSIWIGNFLELNQLTWRELEGCEKRKRKTMMVCLDSISIKSPQQIYFIYILNV